MASDVGRRRRVIWAGKPHYAEVKEAAESVEHSGDDEGSDEAE